MGLQQVIKEYIRMIVKTLTNDEVYGMTCPQCHRRITDERVEACMQDPKYIPGRTIPFCSRECSLDYYYAVTTGNGW